MRQVQAFSGILMGGAVSLVAALPSFAATTQVTAVQLETSENELQLVLETQGNSDERPEIFTVNRGNELVTNIINSQLSLKQGQNFRQENPMPGIAAVSVSQPDPNTVQVTVSGIGSPPTGQ